MTSRVPTSTIVGQTQHKQKWEGLLNGDDGEPWDSNSGASDYNDKSVQVFGNFGAGSQLDLMGSNDGGTTWAILHNFNGDNLSFIDAGIMAIAENVEQIKPLVVSGDGSTNLTCLILARR